MGAARTKVYLDLDPAFNQLWHAQGIDMHFGGHDRFVTVGQAIGTPACTVPTSGIDWIPTVPPVVLAHWPVARAATTSRRSATGAATARSSTRACTTGRRRTRCATTCRSRRAPTRRSGWRSTSIPARRPTSRRSTATAGRSSDPATVAADPDAYRDFIAGSLAELGIAKSGYVLSRCGWFSDRSACYLASGKPVVAQDTGFGRFLPTGEGLLSFADRGRRARRRRGRARRLRRAMRARRARSPRSTSTRARCWRASSSAWEPPRERGRGGRPARGARGGARRARGKRRRGHRRWSGARASTARASRSRSSR